MHDEYYDCILCPQNQVLSYATTNREGYREYKSKSYICKSCPVRERCTQSRQCTKTVTRHVWHEYLERAEDVRHSPTGKATYALRSQTIERVFADAKEKHAMRYTPYRGLAAVTAWVKLRLNPKFCVNSQRGKNRSEFNVCGSGFIRLPPCVQYNAGGDGCQGRRQGRRSSERRAQRRADP